MMILSFFTLGVVFALVFYLITFVERYIRSRLACFVIDLMYMIASCCIFICFEIGYSQGGFRMYFALLTLAGFLFYLLTVHRLITKRLKKF